MAAIMDLVFAVIMVTAVAIRIVLDANTTGLDSTSKTIYNLIPLFLVLGLLYAAGRIGGFVARFSK
jgi:hypothetical protein